MPLIYKITSPSNKIYIGQTWNWIKRKSAYKKLECKNQTFIYHSLLKYGFENHSIEIIEDLPIDISQKELDDREIYWWNYFRELGFIMLNVKEPGKGGKHSRETLDKLSASSKGRIPWNKGVKYSKELSDKMISHLIRNPPGWKMSEESKLKIGLANKGKIRLRKPCSEETKEKIRNANKGRVISKETRQKISEKNKGRKLTNNQKDNIKFSRSGRYIIMLDLEGNFIKEFDYVSDARKFLGVSQNNYINNVLSGLSRTCKGYQFILKENYNSAKNYRIGRGGTKSIDQFDLDGNYIKTHMSFMDAERELRIKYANSRINSCCKGRCKQACGFIWKYKN